MRLEVVGRSVGDDYSFEGQESAAFSDIFGFISKQKTLSLTDVRSQFNPFAKNSFLATRNWRNGKITEYADDGKAVFEGAISDAGYFFSRATRQTRIVARDNLGVLKDATVEELLLKSENSITQQYSVQTSRAAQYSGSITLNNSGSPLNIEVGDIISFNPAAVPRYLVTTVAAGTPTPSVVLDRPLEAAITSGDILRVMAPAEDTGASLLKRAFIAAGLGDRLDRSFDALDIADSVADLTLRVFIRNENKMKLSDYLVKVMEMTDMFVTVTAGNMLSVRRGLQWSGGNIRRAVTDFEIIPDVDISNNSSKLFWAYDCFYNLDGTIAKASGTVSAAVLDRWAANARWQPVSAGGSSARDYQLLYANVTSANFFGNRKILYNGHPRPNFKCKLSRHPAGFPKRPYNLTLGTEVKITHNMGGGRSLVNEPAAVIQFVFDRVNQIYTDVVFELTNYYYPNLKRPPA